MSANEIFVPGMRQSRQQSTPRNLCHDLPYLLRKIGSVGETITKPAGNDARFHCEAAWLTHENRDSGMSEQEINGTLSNAEIASAGVELSQGCEAAEGTRP